MSQKSQLYTTREASLKKKAEAFISSVKGGICLIGLCNLCGLPDELILIYMSYMRYFPSRPAPEESISCKFVKVGILNIY